MTFLSKNWPYLYSIISTVFVVIILYKSCNPVPVPSGELKQLQDSNALYKMYISHLDSDTAYLNFQLNDINRQYDSLNKQLNAAQISLADKSKIVLSLANQVQQNKRRKDTVRYYVSCDSLAAIAETEVAKTNYYIQLSDSLVSAHKKEMEVTYALIWNRDSAYSYANNELFNTSRMYGLVNEENKKLVKQLKTDQVIKKGALVVIAGLLVKIFILK